MKIKAISSIFVLFAIAVGMASMAPTAFAHPNHAEVSIIAFDESTISSYIADIEHDNPVFKEIVKAGLTPMISTLSIMESAETESEVLGLGLSVIALNLAMYLGAPAIVIVGIRKKF